MGPLSAYAETVVYDVPASAGVSDGAAADAVEEDAPASDEPDADGVATDASPVDRDFAHDAEKGAEAANTPEPADEAPDGAGVNEDVAEADAVEADAYDGTGSTSNSADMANSWRFQDGALRTDIEPGISLFSADGLPSGATARGIDVSQWNGAIDWAAVKEAGIDFAILRLGYGSAGTDTQFAANVKGCQENDIPFGVYVYSYAWDAASARSEAQGTLQRLTAAGLSASDLSLPVYYDLENENPHNGNVPSGVDDANQYHDIQGGAATFASIASTFAEVLQGSGYTVGIYANLNWWNIYLTSSVFNSWDRWVAQYNSSCSYEGNYSAWQYTSQGGVAGVNGAVDMNYWYGELPWSSAEEKQVSVSYRTHVADRGWLDFVSDGKLAGTTGESRRVEVLEVHLVNQPYDGGVELRAHVQDIGWQDWTAGVAGTEGKSKRVEAIQIRLTGEMAKHYDVYYRVHAANIGWMAWAKNDEQAGTQGYGYGVEAIQIELVEKGGPTPGSSPASVTRDAFRRKPVDVSYRAHVSNIGWQGYVSGGQTAGTTGRSLGLEALNVTLTNQVLEGTVQVRAHVSNVGWQSTVSGGAMAGTTGQAKHIEAVQIQLTGEMADQYDIYYRTHASGYGWLGWASNGATAGTTGLGRSLEAIQIKLVAKGGPAPGSSIAPGSATCTSTHATIIGASASPMRTAISRSAWSLPFPRTLIPRPVLYGGTCASTLATA